MVAHKDTPEATEAAWIRPKRPKATEAASIRPKRPIWWPIRTLPKRPKRNVLNESWNVLYDSLIQQLSESLSDAYAILYQRYG